MASTAYLTAFCRAQGEVRTYTVDRLPSLLYGALVWMQVRILDRDALLTLTSHLMATVIQYAFNETINTRKSVTLYFNHQVSVYTLSDGQSVVL